MTGLSRADLKPFAEMAERFAKQELAPRAIELDNYPFAPENEAALEAAQAAGLFGMTLPEKLGGVGQGMEALCEALFPLAREDASFAAILLADSFARALLAAGGRADAAQGLGRGKIGVTLYDSPRDPQRGLIVGDGPDGLVLNGQVESVALAPGAEALILPGLWAKDRKPGLFLVDARAEGVTIGPPVPSLGLRGCPVADVRLFKVRGEARMALSADYPAIAAGYLPAVAALAAGVSEGSFRTAREYAAERYQGGGMIIEYGMVRQLLASVAIAAETGKALFREMARGVDRGERATLLLAGAALAADQATQGTTDGVQCLGGYGYMEDYGQEKRMRDAKQIAAIFGPGPVKKMELMEVILSA